MTDPIVIKSVADPSADWSRRIPYVYADGLVEEHISKVIRDNGWDAQAPDLVVVETTIEDLGTDNGVFKGTCHGMDVYMLISPCSKYDSPGQGIVVPPSDLSRGIRYLERQMFCDKVNLDNLVRYLERCYEQ